MSKPEPFVVKPQDHKPLQVVGETITVLAGAERTGSIELFMQSGPEGAGPPPHTHPWDEAAKFLSFNSRGGASRFFADIDREVGGTLEIPKIVGIANRHEVSLAAPPPPAP